MTTRLLPVLLLLIFSTRSFAQPYTITAHLIDATDTSALIGVSAALTNNADTTQKTGGISDANGDLRIENISPGSYTLKLLYLGYKTVTKPVMVTGDNITLGTITMSANAKELKGVTIAGKQIRAEQKGDTSQFRADAYKTNPDASAEDLVTKMPGVTSDNSGVKVNGEAVQQVYVDGKPFFGTDPTLALKNLPAEVIDKIQVFDKLSDQAQFTGFDDGNTQKTLNIITKRNKSEGVFGKVYAGYGTDDRYIAGGNINIFNGDQRISILGLSNNINQQNFSSQDLLGVTAGSGQNRGGGGGFRGGGPGGSGGYGGGAGNFLVGQQGGIATTNSFGINYSDNWGKKIKVTGSYFFNNTDNVNASTITRNYFTTNDTTNVYNENDNSEANNFNHRFNLRMEYNIDSFNTIIFTPGISFQQNKTTSATFATDTLAGSLSSLTNTHNSAWTNGFNSSNNLLIQHKFKKPRRTISLNLNGALSEKSGNGNYYSSNIFYNEIDTSSTIRDQQYTLYNNSNTFSGNVTYTEPVGKNGQLMINYNPSYTNGHADKETYDMNPLVHDYVDLNDTFSNKYNNIYTTQRGGVSYRIGDKKLNFNVGVNAQEALLDGHQDYPIPFETHRAFDNVLPNAMLNYRYADGRNLRIMYRTNVNAPSISQLQTVVDVSNPLLLKTGNAALVQDYEHTFIIRYGLTKAKTAHNFFLNLYSNYINDYIGNETIIPLNASTYVDPVTRVATTINKGGQLTRPVNLNGYWNSRSFLTYGIPVDLLKSNLNFNGGFNFTRTPGIVTNDPTLTNIVVNYSENYIPSFGLVLSSNISEKVDFTLSYSGNYNIVKNTTQTAANNNYYSHVVAFRFNWIFLKNFVFNTNITDNYYTAFSNTGSQDFYLWNAYLGYKFLKNQALEARLSVYDILNQNKSITRTVTETYIENRNTVVLRQYALLQLTYSIRNFKGTMPALPDNDGHDGRPSMRQGPPNGNNGR